MNSKNTASSSKELGYGADIIVLTGAGASAPLGLKVMDSFMTLLEDIATPEETRILQNIYDQNKRDDGQPVRDLEIVLEALNSYKSHIDLQIHDSNLAQRVPQSSEFGKFAQEVQALDTKIKDLIFEHYGTIDPEKTRKLYEPLCELLNQQGRVVFFTTNYDVAIEGYSHATGTRLVDGFTLRNDGRRWDPSVFLDPFGSASEDITVLHKLHGSIDWYRKKSDEPTNIISHLGLSYRNVPNHDNMIVYPNQPKTDLLEDVPYSTLYAHLGGYVRSAKWLIIIGHSLRDKILRERIKEAAANNPNIRGIVLKKKFNGEFKKHLSELGILPFEIINGHFDAGKNPHYLQELKRILKLVPH